MDPSLVRFRAAENVAAVDAALEQKRACVLGPDGVELECEDGGRPAYWWLVTAE